MRIAVDADLCVQRPAVRGAIGNRAGNGDGRAASQPEVEGRRLAVRDVEVVLGPRLIVELADGYVVPTDRDGKVVVACGIRRRGVAAGRRDRGIADGRAGLRVTHPARDHPVRRGGQRGDTVGRAQAGRPVPARTGSAEHVAARTVAASGDVVELRGRAIRVRHRIAAGHRRPGERVHGRSERRRQARSADLQPPVLTVGVVDGQAGVRIGVGRQIGFGPVGASRSNVLLVHGFRLVPRATAAAAAPSGFRPASCDRLIAHERCPTHGNHVRIGGRPTRNVARVSGARGNHNTRMVVVVVQILLAGGSVGHAVGVRHEASTEADGSIDGLAQAGESVVVAFHEQDVAGRARG